MSKRIIVVTHKAYEMPSDGMYLPVCVGTGLTSLGKIFQRDDDGDNISGKNATYCELTAIYWAWKNLPLENGDFIGVAHYRRHFTLKRGAKTLMDVLSTEQLEELVNKHGYRTVFVTPVRKYHPSIEQHYITSMYGYREIHEKDIECLKQAIKECSSPEYFQAGLKVLTGKTAHMLNMFIMNAEMFREYCAWLFPVIDRVVELRKSRSDQRRYAGALSEFCLDIWLAAHQIQAVEIPLLETEKISFLKRVIQYIKRKMP